MIWLGVDSSRLRVDSARTVLETAQVSLDFTWARTTVRSVLFRAYSEVEWVQICR